MPEIVRAFKCKFCSSFPISIHEQKIKDHEESTHPKERFEERVQGIYKIIQINNTSKDVDTQLNTQRLLETFQRIFKEEFETALAKFKIVCYNAHTK